MLELDTGSDGARSANGRVEGSYLHGLFANDAWRRAWLARAGATADASWSYDAAVDRALDDVATDLSTMLDADALLAAARTPVS